MVNVIEKNGGFYMYKTFYKCIITLLSLILIFTVVDPLTTFAFKTAKVVEACTEVSDSDTECEDLEYISDEEIEKMGGAEPLPADKSELKNTVKVTRDNFSSDKEYEKYLDENTYMSGQFAFLIPPAIAVVSRVASQLVVKQTLKATTKNIVIRNGKVASKLHPVTKVAFNSNGFPQFAYKVQLALPKELIKSSSTTQFRNLNQQLLIQIQTNSTVRAKFTSAQISNIKKLKNPTGYTWHHHQNTGIMQLVNSTTHSKTGHTGGKAIWGSL